MVRRYKKGKGKASVTEEYMPPARLIERASIVDAMTGEMLDDGMVVYFAGLFTPKIWFMQLAHMRNIAPKSFTTEDVLELHVHSGRAIISSILHSLSKVAGCRPAIRGEFTRRAFEGGRLDLTQVEGLRDLIDAETSEQRKLALRMAEVCCILS